MADQTDPYRDLATDGLVFYTRLKKDDPQAYRLLMTQMYNLFVPWVCGTAEREGHGGTESEAADVLQDCLAIFLENIRSGAYQYQPTARVTTYLFAICKRQWFTYVKLRTKRREDPFEAERTRYDDETGYAETDELHALPSMEEQEDLAEKNRLLKGLEEALTKLGDGCQKMVVWSYLDMDKVSLREIAGRLSITEGSATVKRSRCLEQMRAYFRKKGLL